MKKPGTRTVAEILGIVAFLVLAVYTVMSGSPDNPTTQSVNITFPGGFGLEMDVSQSEIAHSALLTQLFSEEFTRDGVLGWLGREQQVYSISDVELVTALERSLCEPIPDSPLQERIEKARECAARPVANGLRRLQEEKKPPFHYVGIQVRVGVQAAEGARPALGRANVCRESDLFGKQIELTDPVSGNEIVVRASGSYPCTGFSRYPDVQLGPDQARDLFVSALLEYQDAVAVSLD